MSWSLKFDEPIALAKGKALRTLRDAGNSRVVSAAQDFRKFANQ